MLQRVWSWLRRQADIEIEDRAWREARVRDEGWHTGTWATGSRSVLVRWDPIVKVFFVSTRGWAGRSDETAWVNRKALRRYLEVLERRGAVPARDRATRAVRARLDMEGWETPHPL